MNQAILVKFYKQEVAKILRQITLESDCHKLLAMTVNEVCGSGLKALILGMEQIQLSPSSFSRWLEI